MSKPIDIELVYRPLSRPLLPTGGDRKPPPFRKSTSAVVRDLVFELAQLDVKQPVIVEVDIDPRNIRLDNQLRGDAKPKTPGIRITFTSRGRTMMMSSARYGTFKENLQAIAMTLQALRGVQRWGCAASGEQYRGWEALPPGEADLRPTSLDGARNTLAALAYGDGPRPATAHETVRVLSTRALYRAAAKQAHPDAGGTPEQWRRLQIVKAYLDAEHPGELDN